jgi:exonuclease SbcC
MLIEEIEIKNFKSYGNNLQSVKISPDKGELILLHGANGNGKSSLSEALDYALFNKVKGKKKKYATLNTLPNRLNNNLFTAVNFKIGQNDFRVERGMNPNKLELIINQQPYDRTGKANINEKIEEIIGIDLDTFKSFISMSINDFKNFMTLSPDEKRKLLDKLFNLGVLNDLSTILKDLKRNNEQELTRFNDQ